MKDDYQIGDKVWIYAPHHSGEKEEQEIVHIFERHGSKHYVCMTVVPGLGEEIMEVRQAYAIAQGPTQPIGLFSSIKKSWRAEGKNFID